MKLTHTLAAMPASAALLFAAAAFADNKAAAIDEIEAYLDFVDYGGATILSEQIPREDWTRFHMTHATRVSTPRKTFRAR
jgi:hypothetical protein